MIIIGEKINGSIPAVAKAIAERDEKSIRNRARMQADAGVDFINICASAEERWETETLDWLVSLIQEVTDVPICIESPNPHVCVTAMSFCKKAGMIRSVSMEGKKIDVIFPAIADTEWSCIALLCDDKDIPGSVERRIHAFEQIMEKAEQYGIEPFRLYVDPMAVTLSTNGNALTMFAECCRRIREQVPEIHITSAVSNISFGLPVRKSINQAFVTLAMKMGLDSAIVDPTNRDMLGIIYATDALLEKDEYCLEYISAYREGRIGPSVNPSNFVLNGQYSLN